jgi:hypothetical protein
MDGIKNDQERIQMALKQYFHNKYFLNQNGHQRFVIGHL